MTPETEAKLAKVRKYSASLRLLFNFFTALIVIGGVISLFILLLAKSDDTSIAIGTLVFRGDEITPALQLLGAIGLLISFGIAFKLLRHLSRLFGLYAEGQIFTAENVRQIRQIGISVFLFCLIWAWEIVVRVILVATNHPLPAQEAGDKTLSLQLSNGLFNAVIAGIIIIVVSWIMDVGRELREEQDLTV